MVAGVTPRQLLGVALLSCAAAALFGANPLKDWVDTSILADTVVQQAADEWLSVTRWFGFDRPYDVLRQAVRQVQGPH